MRYNSCDNPFNNEQNPEHDTELETFGEAGNGEPYIHMARNPPPLRSRHNERSRLAENWIRTRPIIADLLVLRKTEEECTCDMQATCRVRFIGLESYFYRDVEYCSCGVSCTQLAKEGYFPSTPVRPATVFSLRLLRLLHEQSVLGSVSNSAWAGGLRAVYEADRMSAIPSFDREVSIVTEVLLNTNEYIQMRNAYHNWLAVQYQINTTVASALDTMNVGAGSCKWQINNLSNICPCCFDINANSDEDTSIAISKVDGNQQPIRFKDRSPFEFEKYSPKLFIDYGRRKFTLAGGESVGHTAGCGNKFKATSGWNQVEAMSQSKKALDETGLTAVTCYHGTNLRFLNVYGGNERYSHAIRLLESIKDDCPVAGSIQLCYDVVCESESSLRWLNAPWVERVRVSINH